MRPVRHPRTESPLLKIFISAGLAAGLLSAAAITACSPVSASVSHDLSRDQGYDQTNDRAAGNPNTNDRMSSTRTRVVPGDRVGDDDRNGRDVVVDWENENLESPPSGYSWLKHDVSGQYLLTEMRTGRVVDAVDQEQARADRFDNRQDNRR